MSTMAPTLSRKLVKTITRPAPGSSLAPAAAHVTSTRPICQRFVHDASPRRSLPGVNILEMGHPPFDANVTVLIALAALPACPARKTHSAAAATGAAVPLAQKHGACTVLMHHCLNGTNAWTAGTTCLSWCAPHLVRHQQQSCFHRCPGQRQRPGQGPGP